MADKGKYSKWGLVGTDVKNVVPAGRNAYVNNKSADRAAEWRECTPGDPNRGTIRRGRAAWATGPDDIQPIESSSVSSLESSSSINSSESSESSESSL